MQNAQLGTNGKRKTAQDWIVFRHGPGVGNGSLDGDGIVNEVRFRMRHGVQLGQLVRSLLLMNLS